ncbi:hypothetical protein AAW14_34605 [Streptomyces hygroscopicus]|nr:hypothetical protein [Streptomyces hygroscopicus]
MRLAWSPSLAFRFMAQSVVTHREPTGMAFCAGLAAYAAALPASTWVRRCLSVPGGLRCSRQGPA